MKKGILFTLGLTFFAFIVLSLSFIFADNSVRYDQRFTEIASINRVYDLGFSLQGSIAEMFQLYSGITYTASSTEAIFQAELPLDYNRTNSSFTELINFVYTYDNKSVKIGSFPRNFSLTIIPQGIIFWQDLTENASYYTVGSDKPLSYYFNLDMIEQNITNCNSSYTPGSFNYQVSAFGGNGTSCNLSLLVDPSFDAYVGITTLNGAAVVRLSNYSASIHAGKTPLRYTTSVTYTDNVDRREVIELNQEINVTIKGLIASSLSNVRLT